MSEQHKFRYLLPPGNNFAFVAKFKGWLIFAAFAMVACIAMLFVNKSVRGEYLNWTIDFKGGSEIILAFKDKATGNYTKADLGKVRGELESTDKQVEVSEISWTAQDTAGNDVRVEGVIVRTTRFSALEQATAQAVVTDAQASLKDKEAHKVAWSGDRLNVRSQKAVTVEDIKVVFARHGLEAKPWAQTEVNLYTRPDEGTGEYNQWFSISGLDKQYELAIEKAQPTIDVAVVQSYGVGAKAGDKLRDDAIKSLVYAIFLIMLYLAFRFDIRYAPGAALATVHDAVMVIGVFAITYTEVSLTTVAGLLTVMGFSVNDTVIVFDRIRENQAKLKDKKLDRIVDISLNEMLVRSLLTSATVFSTTLVMNIFGEGLVKNFAFTMNIGVIVGVYSSLFIATPVFLFVSRKWYSGTGPAKRRVLPSSPQPSPVAAGDEE
jgi:preprotein translocase subunit SecF